MLTMMSPQQSRKCHAGIQSCAFATVFCSACVPVCGCAKTTWEGGEGAAALFVCDRLQDCINFHSFDNRCSSSVCSVGWSDFRQVFGRELFLYRFAPSCFKVKGTAGYFYQWSTYLLLSGRSILADNCLNRPPTECCLMN